MNYFLIGLAIVVIVFIFMSRYFAQVIIYPRVHPYQEVYDLKVEDGTLDPQAWDSWEKEEIWVDSTYGYQLHGYWLPVENAIGTVILVHGITVNHFASIKYVLPFRSRGFNILMYDHRNHGKSGGTYTTFGYLEKYDLKTVVDWVVEKTGGIGIIGTHGESLGAATCLQHVSIDSRLSFVVEDCGYANLVDLFRFRLKEEYKLPGKLIIPAAGVFIHKMAGFRPQEIVPERMIAEVETPIFFIHGAQDTYIPPSHAERMFAAKKKGFRKLWLAPNAEHALSQPENPEEYNRLIGEFLTEIEVN